MAVQVPRLKQIQSSNDTRGRRIKANVQNQANDILGSSQAVTGVVEAGFKVADTLEKIDLKKKEEEKTFLRTVENDEINRRGYENENKYKVWKTEKLNKIAQFKGDPTKKYVDFHNEEEAFVVSLLESKDNTERVTNALEEKLRKVQDKTKLQTMKQRGLQEEVYANNLEVTTLRLKKTDLSNDASHIEASEPNSFKEFDRTIGGIKTAIARRGVTNGTVKRLPDDSKKASHVYTDPDGKVVKVAWTKASQYKLAKELDDGISKAIEAVTLAGYTDKAEVMLEKYKDQLEPKTHAKLADDLKTENGTQKAHQEANRIMTTSDKDMWTEEVKKIKDPEEKHKVDSLITAKIRNMKVQKTERENRHYDSLAKYVDTMKAAGKANSLADIQDTPQMKKSWKELSRKQQKSIEQIFKPANVSNPDSRLETNTVLLGDLTKVTPAKFQIITSGLIESEKKSAWNSYRSLKLKQEKDPNMKGVIQRAEKMLKRKLLNSEDFKYNDETSQLDGDSKKKLNFAYEELIDYLDGVPSSVSPKELSDHMDKFIGNIKKSEVFGGGVGLFSRFTSSSKEIAANTYNPNFRAIPAQVKKREQENTDYMNVFEGKDRTEINKIRFEYRNAFPSRQVPMDDDKAFKKWAYENQKGNKTRGGQW